MNREVQVSGMQLKTKVSSNLLICDNNKESDYSSLELVQSRKALLEPVSTITATDTGFFYTLDAAADGHKIQGTDVDPYVGYSETTPLTAADTYADKTKYDSQFNTKYGNTSVNTSGEYKTAYGYVDYTFYLKATTDAPNQSINMTRCNMLWNNGSSGASDSQLAAKDTAWRVAVFATDITAEHPGDEDTSATPSTGTAKTILGFDTTGSTYFTDKKGVKDATTLDTVSALGTAAVIDTISDANTTKYYKVVVRVWLEGEDENCYSSYFAEKLELYKLDLAFELGKGTPVTTIGSTTSGFTPASGT